MPRIPGAVASPGRLLATPVAVSLCCPLGWGGMALAARCSRRPGMTCRLCFHSGASYLSCVCHSNKQCLCPKSLRCPSVVCLCFSHHHPLSLGLIGHWPLKGATGLGWGHLPPLRLVGKERDEPASQGKRDQKNPVPAPASSLHEQFLLFRNCFKCYLLYEPCHFQVRELCPSATHPRSLGTVTAWLLCLLPSVDQGF